MQNLSPEELQRRKKINKVVLPIMLVLLIGTCGTCMLANNDDSGEVTETSAVAASAEITQDKPVSKWDAWVTKHTSPWDGSCRPVEKIIKNALNDPDSYDHDATGYIPNEDTSLIVVTTRFRANNGFGAKMLAVYQATVDVNGNVIDLKDLNN